MKFELISTRSYPTIKVTINKGSFYLHSKYHPEIEAKKWVGGIKPEKTLHPDLIVIGMGAGHHIRALMNEFNSRKIRVFDFNVEFSEWILKSGLVDDLIADERIEYLSVKTKKELDLLKSFLNENVIIYQPTLKLFSEQFSTFRNKLEDFIMQERTILDQKDFFLQNFELNVALNDPGLLICKKIENRSMILVSAGPSLTKQLPTLKEVFLNKSHVIGAVGTAFKPLVNYGIVPDFVMISDPKDQIVEQFEGEVTDISTLFYLSTANHLTVSKFKGPRYIVWQEGLYSAEAAASKRNEPLIKTGGSVATCLLDLMVVLGAKKVALIGQDLAYTDMKSHADNTHALRDISITAFLKEIPDYYKKNTVYTSKNLCIYLEWFERYVELNRKTDFFNCTEGGAYIDGWNHLSFREFIMLEQ